MNGAKGVRPAILEATRSKPLSGGPSFTLRHRLVRAGWQFTWLLFASWTPRIFRPWRILLLRLFGADIHTTANIYSSAKIWYPPNLRMDAYACLGPRVDCYSMALITLGEGCIVSQDAHLCAGTHDINDASFQLIAKPISVERGAWVAAGAFVGPGVTVKRGAVVGARAVLFKDTEAQGVYVGNPAKIIKYRTRAEPECDD